MTDLRLAIRRLLKSPGSTAAAVLALALGIGLSGTMFSSVDLLFLQGIPFKDREQVVSLSRVNVKKNDPDIYFPISDFLEYREQQTTFEQLGAVKVEPINISEVGRSPGDCLSSLVSVNTFDLLGVQPILGRAFLPEEGNAGAEPVCLISQRLWENQFGGDDDILERHATINNRKHRIIGVMGKGFGFPMMSDVWRPLIVPQTLTTYRERPWVELFGRVKTEHTREEATSELSVIAQRLEEKYGESHQDYRAVAIEPFGQKWLGSGAVKTMWLMVLASIGVLFIACANVANLLLVRSSLRTRELAVRAALGATRRSLIVSVLIESLVLALLGCIAGLGVALAGFAAQDHFHHLWGVPYWWIVAPNWRFFALITGLTTIVALLAGLYPALRTSRPDVNEALKDSAGGATGAAHGLLSRGLVVVQLAISCALVSAAGMLALNGYNLRQTNLPYNPDVLLSAQVSLPREQYDTSASRRDFFHRLLTELRSRPDVEQAALATHRGVHDTVRGPVMVEGKHHLNDKDKPWTRHVIVSPGYFTTLGVPIIRGRDFRESDEQVAVINAPMAERLWPDEDPIGKRFKSAYERYPWLTVIGIAPDLQVAGQFNANRGGEDAVRKSAGFYVPHRDSPWADMYVIMKPRGQIAGGVQAIRKSLAAIDPTVPMLEVKTLRGSMDAALIILNTIGIMFAIFGASAILLAAIGLYGVISFAVAQRTREIGIRMALGAARRQVFAMILRQGITLLLIGLPIGIAIGYALNRGLAKFLHGLTPDSLTIWLTTIAALTLAAIAALLSPAWKAIHVNPMTALRHD